MIQIIVNGEKGAGKSAACAIIIDALRRYGYQISYESVHTKQGEEPKMTNGAMLALNRDRAAFVQVHEMCVAEPPRGVTLRGTLQRSGVNANGRSYDELDMPRLEAPPT